MSQPYFIFLFTLVWMIPDLVDVHKKEGCMHLNEIFPMQAEMVDFNKGWFFHEGEKEGGDWAMGYVSIQI